MKPFTIKILSLNSPVLIGKFMLVFSRRKIDVTNFGFQKINDEDGEFSIEFVADQWTAENVQKQMSKIIDVFKTTLI